MHNKENSKLPLFGGRPLNWCFDNYSFDLTINGQDGKGISMLWYPITSSSTTIPEPPRYRRVHFSNSMPTKSKFVYPFEDREASSVQVSGGKGASLAILTSISNMDQFVDNFYCNEMLFKENKSILKNRSRRESYDKHHENLARIKVACPKFTVPKGFVVSVSALDLMLERNVTITREIEILADLCLNGTAFEGQCDKIMNVIVQAELDKVIIEDVKEALKLLMNEDLRIAVRSSSVCEDGEETSAAGQNETFLGLKTVEDVLEAIKKCWASLYAYQSVKYRQQNIQPIKTGMAVVIQSMLPAESAGVLFTIHPISGDPKKSLISANFGLGEVN